jgi:UDP-N-acetylmuramoyl-L-alanyl-D-glutamate--2,6-diaminopimelate ligase
VRLDKLLSESDLPRYGVEAELSGDPSVDVTGIALDSRLVEPGFVFACVPGGSTDGHDYAEEALERGAAALLCERALPLDCPELVVPSVRRALGPVSDAYFGHPSRRMTVAGVTGTNGKTTTCALLSSIFEASGWATETIGTLTQSRTTPEAPELQRILADWSARGGRAVAMEVSSHALAQHRADAVEFAAGVFTNLSPDHLDYHHTMESYFDAKLSLFERGHVSVAVVNADDLWGRRLAQRVSVLGREVATYTLADAKDLEVTPDGSRFGWDGHDVWLTLGGRFNVSNALAAATAARALGVAPGVVAAGLSSLRGVPGRFELVSAGQPFAVVVDYAHTPDGLDKVLSAAREISRGRLIVVFGAGGDRDRDKRPSMGEVASRLADLAVVTTDNPRSEDPGAIIDAIVSGAAGRTNVTVEPDRGSAIAAALANATAGDVVVIAGKGHERTQEIGGRTVPFDDVTEARTVLERIGSSRREAK